MVSPAEVGVVQQRPLVRQRTGAGREVGTSGGGEGGGGGGGAGGGVSFRGAERKGMSGRGGANSSTQHEDRGQRKN